VPFIVSIVFYCILGSSLAYNYMLSKDIKDLQATESTLVAYINQLTIDQDEVRQGLAWWKHRCQVIAIERDNARRALETVWQPTIKVVKDIKHVN